MPGTLSVIVLFGAACTRGRNVLPPNVTLVAAPAVAESPTARRARLPWHDVIPQVAFLADGSAFVAAARGAAVRVELPSLRLTWTTELAPAEIFSVVVDAEGRRAGVVQPSEAGQRLELRLLDAASGRLVDQRDLPMNQIVAAPVGSALAWLEPPPPVAEGARDRPECTVVVSFADGRSRRTELGQTPRSLSFSPAGRFLFVGGDAPRVLDLSGRGADRVFDGGSGRAAMSSDDAYVAWADLSGGEARLWNVARDVVVSLSDPDCIGEVAFAPNGRVVAVGSYDFVTCLFSVPDGTLLGTLPTPRPTQRAVEDEGTRNPRAFLDDGRTLVVRGGWVSEVFDVETRTPLLDPSEEGVTIPEDPQVPRGLVTKNWAGESRIALLGPGFSRQALVPVSSELTFFDVTATGTALAWENARADPARQRLVGVDPRTGAERYSCHVDRTMLTFELDPSRRWLVNALPTGIELIDADRGVRIGQLR